MSEGTESPLKTGSDFETREAAQNAVRNLVDNGFKKQENGVTFDNLQSIRALALRLGYTHILDKRDALTPANFLGRTPLKDWTGVSGLNDAVWEYAIDYGKISARPKLRVQMPDRKMSGREFVAALKPALDQQKSLGGEQTFPITRT
jgi:hypothetical protein